MDNIVEQGLTSKLEMNLSGGSIVPMPGKFLVVRLPGHAYYKFMTIALVMLLILLLSPLHPAGAADVSPAPPQPNYPLPPQKVEPSPRDPGIVKQPETVPHPGSVVTPPVVDPKMAVDPDAPTKEERHPMLPPSNTPQPSPPGR